MTPDPPDYDHFAWLAGEAEKAQDMTRGARLWCDAANATADHKKRMDAIERSARCRREARKRGLGVHELMAPKAERKDAK